ncbi:hypothetical protein PybrP1_003065 [[Pythium] brassicae (nom. inval.)]|nr:hypothetical protein PybrP1_003065 [[Pythium] brassicae (nom. inval.)]
MVDKGQPFNTSTEALYAVQDHALREKKSVRVVLSGDIKATFALVSSFLAKFDELRPESVTAFEQADCERYLQAFLQPDISLCALPCAQRIVGLDALCVKGGAKFAYSIAPTDERTNSTGSSRERRLGPQRVPRTPHTLLNTHSVAADDCAAVWRFLTDWTQSQLAMEAPATIPCLGTVSLKTHALNIRIPHFDPDPSFLDAFGLQATGVAIGTASTSQSVDKRHASAVFAFSYLEMAACCGRAVDASTAQEWLQAVIQKIGQAMKQHKHVELNIGVGVISCVDKVIDSQVASRAKGAKSTLAYEIRTGESVVKRRILNMKALLTPKATNSFLTSDEFSQAIQVNPVYESANSMPSSAFDLLLPRRPLSQQQQQQRKERRDASLTQVALVKASPRTTGLSPDPPTLFDPLNRTLCVEPGQNAPFLLPSNRIATNFTPSAGLLVMQTVVVANGSVSKAAAAGLVLYEEAGMAAATGSSHHDTHPRVVAPDLLTLAESEKRYFEFISEDHQLVERRWLSPIAQGLIDRIVAAAVKYLVEPPSGHMLQILSLAQDEFVANYYVSAKKAILDYLLLREHSRVRLGVPAGTPRHALLPAHWKWGSNDGSSGCLDDLKMLAARQHSSASAPTAAATAAKDTKRTRAADRTARNPHNGDDNARRRQRVKARLSALYMLSDPILRALQAVWHEVEPTLLLVDLPTVEELSSSAALLDLHEFEAKQVRHAAGVKAHLMNFWYGRARSVVENAVRAELGSLSSFPSAAVEQRIRHLFDAIATLMSLQLRSLIVKSVQAYAAFFELFEPSASHGATAATHHDPLQQQNSPQYSGLLLALVLQNNEVQFRNALEDIPSHLLSVLHNMPQLFHNTARVEAQFACVPPLASPRSAPFLWDVVSQEDEIVLATIRIREIVERSLGHLDALRVHYAAFAQLHRRVRAIDTQELAEHSDIAACRSEMASVRATAERITAETRDRAYLRLFCVDCSRVNALLLAGLDQWTTTLLHAFQEHTARLNGELRHEYKDVAARLAKKPMDLYELVDAEEFVGFLKATRIRELQSKADSIQGRVRFLLFERGSVRVDVLMPSQVHERAMRTGDDGSESELSPSGAAHALAPFRLSPELLTTTVKSVKWRGHIAKLLQDAEASLVTERARIETIFLAKRTRIQAEIEEFDSEVRGFAKKGDLRHAATYVVQLAKLKDTLVSFRKTMDAIAAEERKLQWKATDFSKLDDIAEAMEPYEQLWKTAREFREMSARWLRGNVFELEPGEGMQTLHQMLATVSNVSKLLHLNAAATAITAEMVKKQIADFRETARLVAAILNPSMQTRHLREVTALVGVTLDPEEPVALLKLLENGAFEHLPAILAISQNATQEKRVEDALIEIAAEWRDVRLAFKPTMTAQRASDSQRYRELHPAATPAPIVSGESAATSSAAELDTKPDANTTLMRSCIEETHRVVEDNQARLQSLLCMQHAVPFALEIASWLQFTQRVRRLVDLLSDVGRAWKALHPLFAAGVVEPSSKEATLFSAANQLYKVVVLQIRQQPLCCELVPRAAQSNADPAATSAGSSADAMVADLGVCLELLEAAKANLRVGLDGKRRSFARFCFLSDLELVNALSCRNAAGAVLLESRALWENLAACFPGIHSVHVNSSKEVTAIGSSVGETFSLGSPIGTATVAMASWLGQVETAMVTMLQASIRAAVSDASRKEFRKWCLLWPEQVLVVAIQHTWTLQCEHSQRRGSVQESLSAWGAVVTSLRERHSAVVRELKAAVHAHIKVSLANVLLLLRHLQDVSTAALEELRVDAWQIESLAWLAQPRYYYEDNTFVVKVGTAAPISYGFEYLANGSSTFFLTPLTLRCFHAIAQTAAVLGRGTCLRGAAGTGKTALVGALASTCGQLLARFECGNAFSLALLLQFVRGAATSGAWLAMENFQFVERAQAAVVGYVCAQAMDAIAAKQTHCVLLGDKLRIKRGCHFSIVLQSDGSSASSCNAAVHERARFFFKPVEVQSPDIEVVTERVLQQSRFVHAAVLSKLIIAVLSSASGADDSQSRAVISARMTANDALDSHEVEKLERKLVCLALRAELNAVLPTADSELVDCLLRDVSANSLARELRAAGSYRIAPRVVSASDAAVSQLEQQRTPPASLEGAVEEFVRTKTPAWVALGAPFGLKVVQLLQAMAAGRAVVVSGDIQSGKTALYNALADALSHVEVVAPTRCVVIAPRALALEDLYGSSAEHFGSTQLANLIRDAKRELSSSWCETLVYLVEELQDDAPGHRKGLRLASGKRVLLPRCMRLVLETTQLANVTPSFLTRVAVVNLGRAAAPHDWRGLYQAWKQRHKAELSELASEVFGVADVVLEETVDAALNFVAASFQHGFPQLSVARFTSLLALFHSSLRQSWAKVRSMVSAKQRNTAILCFYLQALVWGIGSTSDAHERQCFHEFLRHWIIHGPHSAQSALKRVLVLFFPSGATGTVQSMSAQSGATPSLLSRGGDRALSASAATAKDLIYAFGFSVEYGLKWMRWTEYYELWLQTQASLSAGGRANVRGNNGESGESAGAAALADLVVPTGPMAAAICQMNQLLLANYPVLLDGPADSGKSACGVAWLALNGVFSRAQSAADATIQPSFGTGGEADPGTATQFQQVQDASGRARKRLSFVFVDDLQCLNAAATMNSAVELLRMLVERRQAVHPSLKHVVSCANILPLAAIQASRVFRANSDGHRDFVRLTSRFVRVALPPLTDADVSSICQAAVATPPSDASASVSVAALGDAQEVHQLVSIVIKASIKLFRFLSGEFVLYAAETPFDPRKLHYQFRVREVQDVVRSVCCDSKQRLSLANKPLLARLWCHESARTFGDRLADATERAIFHQHARDIALGSFGLAPDVLVPEASVDAAQSHVWLANELHFTFIGESSGAGFMEGYREVSEMHKVELSVERSMMAMYRANGGAESLEIVICGYVIRHVLRLARLLRHSGQHVLLLGSRGTRMATITRLAAFICKKASVVYSVPATHPSADDNGRDAAWKHALKSAVLRSVRNRDERIVFIVKDASLSSTEHWDAVERFVAGATLSSDVLSYDDLDDHILGVLRDQAHQDRDESRGGTGSASVLGSKASVLEYFFAQVRERLQMVIILSEPPYAGYSADQNLDGAGRSGALASVLWRTPQLLKHCAINHFGDWPEESLATIALKGFAVLADVGKDRVQQLSQVAAQIFLTTQRCFDRCSRTHCSNASNSDSNSSTSEKLSTASSPLLSWHDQLPALRLDPSILLDQVGLFLKFSGPLQRAIAANKDKYESGLAFLDSSERTLATEHAQTQVLQPEMQKRTEVTRRMSGSLEREKLAADKLDRALELAINLVDAQQKRLANAEAEYRELVRESMSEFAETQAKIAVFQVAKSEEYEVDDALSTKADTPMSPSLPDELSQQSSDGNNSVDTHSAAVAEASDVTSSEGDTLSAELTTSASDAAVESAIEFDPERELRRQRRALIKSFALLKPVPTAFKQLAECLGLIFGIQPVEARDELDPDEVFMDYWESLTARMKSTAFWNDLVAYDIEARVNDRILARILPVCTSPDFEVELFASLHALAGELCAWVKAWSNFARDIILAGPKFAQLVQEREAFTSAQRDVLARRREIVAQQTTNTELSALRHVSEQERRDLEMRLQDNASTLQMATSVWKLLAASRAKWRAAYEHYTELSAQWIGDLIVGTSVIAYASCANARVRAYLRSQWSADLRRHCLVHSATCSRALPSLFLVDDLRLSKWHIDGLPVGDPSAVENAVITTSCYRFPVLVDPHGVATEWIKRREAGGTLQEVSCNAILDDDASASATWKTLETVAKKQHTVLLTDFGEESASHLRSLLVAKRRSLFEAVNRDISSLGGVGSSNTSGMSRFLVTSDGGAVSYPCWFHLPAKAHGAAGSGHSARPPAQQHPRFLSPSATDGSSLAPTTVEFGSEAWRVYFVYSRTDSVPHWMLAYLSQLSIVAFEFSTALVETQCLTRIAEASGEQHLLTETQALRIDALSCQEQIDAIENELLDFFSTEPAELVYADVSKSLRVIGNRSALHALASSQIESESKILANRAALDQYRGLLSRALDVALAWRDVNTVLKQEMQRCEDPDPLALPWIWTLLARSLQQCAPHAAVQDMVDVYTSYVRSYTSAGLSDENQVVFAFLLALRVHDRAAASLPPTPSSAAVEGSGGLDESPSVHWHRDAEALYRTLQVVLCCDENEVRSVCASVPAKLVALRPDSLAPTKWRAVCYLADASSELREFVLRAADPKAKTADTWKELADFNAARQAQVSTRPLAELSPVIQLCVISVVHSELLLPEIEHFAALQLDSDACSVSDTMLFELWYKFSSSRIPIAVSPSSQANLLHQVECVALKARMTIDRQMFYDTLPSASDKADDVFERRLLAAMQNGHWAVLTSAHLTPSRLARLRRLFDRLDDQQLHADFRLWLSSESDGGADESCSTGLPNEVPATATSALSANVLTVHKHHQSGSFALQRSVLHAFALLADDPQSCELAASGGEQLFKRAGLLHAILTAGDQLGFAHWNTASEGGAAAFGDGELQAMIVRGEVHSLWQSDDVSADTSTFALDSSRRLQSSASSPGSPIENLLKLAVELDAVAPSESDATFIKAPSKYKKPLSQLVRRELESLNSARLAIVDDIRRMQAIHTGGQPTDEASWTQFCEVKRGLAPQAWLHRLESHSESVLRRDGCPLDNFQQVFTCRWQQLKDRGSQQPVMLSVTRKEDAVFLCGVRLMGELQRDIKRPKLTQRRKSALAGSAGSALLSPPAPLDEFELRPEGVPVVLEITSACMATTTSSVAPPTSSLWRMSTLRERRGSAPGVAPGSEQLPQQAARTAFLCPVYRSDPARGPGTRPETELCVMSARPLAELLLSGSRLCVASLHLHLHQ